jgi:hypothetical protein
MLVDSLCKTEAPMTTAKTAREIEHLVMAELLETCPECVSITDVMIIPTDEAQDEGHWQLAATFGTIRHLLPRAAGAPSSRRSRGWGRSST